MVMMGLDHDHRLFQLIDGALALFFLYTTLSDIIIIVI